MCAVCTKINSKCWLQETSEIFPFVLENFTALDKGIEKYISDLDISKFD